MTVRELDVWLYGTRLATISESTPDRLELTWADEALARWGPDVRILSAKLSIGSRPSAPLVRNYLDGLLPEGNARTNHAISAGVPPDDTFGLIRAYGRDTLGAAIFAEPGIGDPTRHGSYIEVSEDDVAHRLLQADQHSPAADGVTVDSSTLPGMIPKITLHRDNGTWSFCKDGAPSTWIIKRAQAPSSDLADVVDTEVACLALARQMGLTSIAAEIFETADVRGIAVSRYDRDPDLERIHQEDLAQAIGLNTSDPNKKFQWGSSMPSLRYGADVLRLDGANPDELLRLVTFSHLVGNTDMHAKNISFLRLDDGRVSLSPAYDIAMHLHHKRDNRRSAMDVNGKQAMAAITFEDLVSEGRTWGMTPRRARAVAQRAVTDLARSLETIDRAEHAGVSKEAWSRVEHSVDQFLDQAGTAAPVDGGVALTAEGKVTTGAPSPEATELDRAVAHAKRRGPRRPK